MRIGRGWRAGRDAPAVAPTAADDRDFARRSSFSVDFWRAYLVYLGVRRRALAPTMAIDPRVRA